MFNRFRSWASQWLGARADAAEVAPLRFAQRYESGDEDPVTRVIAGKLAALTFADSTLRLTCDAPSPRARAIEAALQALWKRDALWITAQVFGKGGMALVPVVTRRGGLRTAAVSQSRLLVLRSEGREIEHAALLLDEHRDGDRLRWLAMSCACASEGQALRFTAFDDTGARLPLACVDAWAHLPEELTIQGAHRPLITWLRCPRDARTDAPLYGVPITYGAEALIDELMEHARVYRREYRLTRPMLGLDATLWRDVARPGERMDIRAVRRTVQDGDDPFIPLQTPSLDNGSVWQYYAPAIRHEAMEARWQSLSRRVERVCGLSQGILTERQAVSYANRDEVRAALYDTFTVIKGMRAAWEQALEALTENMDILSERFRLTDYGGRQTMRLQFDWDMSLIESSAETFRQLSTLQERGGLSLAELRAWQTGETEAEAKRAIDEV